MAQLPSTSTDMWWVGLLMLLEGLLTSSVPTSARLLDFTETAAFASPSECESVTIDDVNERLKVRGWLHWRTEDLLCTPPHW